MLHIWIKSITLFSATFILVYSVFIADVGHQSMASHAVDVWGSPVMEEKRAIIYNEFRGWWQNSLFNLNTDRKKPQLAQQSVRPSQRRRHEGITPHDRRKLDKLIDAATVQ